MIELISKNSKRYSVDSVDEIVDEKMDFIVVQFHDYTEKDTDWLRNNFNLDFSIMSHYEDIEISSHLLEFSNQISFHFSMPYYNKGGKMVEEHVFVIMSASRVCLFTSSVLDKYLSEEEPDLLHDPPQNLIMAA